jgi:hypothetical protein
VLSQRQDTSIYAIFVFGFARSSLVLARFCFAFHHIPSPGCGKPGSIMALEDSVRVSNKDLPQSSESSNSRNPNVPSFENRSQDAIIPVNDVASETLQFGAAELPPKPSPSRPFVRYLPQSFYIRHVCRRASNFIHEWTPFLLVATYFITSVFAYMLFPPKLTEIFWFIYNFTNFITAASTALEAFISPTPNRDARGMVAKAADEGWTFPTPDDQLLILDIVIVAYLPNEKDILMNRIHYAVEEIVYPNNKIRINIVYNTPVSIDPLETQMSEVSAKYSQLRIIKVENSTSKADNLKLFSFLGHRIRCYGDF